MQSQIVKTQLYSVLFYSALLVSCEAYNSLQLTHVQQKKIRKGSRQVKVLEKDITLNRKQHQLQHNSNACSNLHISAMQCSFTKDTLEIFSIPPHYHKSYSYLLDMVACTQLGRWQYAKAP